MDIKKFSKHLSLCMEQCGVNGRELSASSGVTAATISRYLNGLWMPTVGNVILLADSLNVSVDYLLGLHDVPSDKILTAAYLQSWTTDFPADIQYDIAPKLAWDGKSYATEAKRNCDLFVFCLYTALTRDKSILDLEYWEFYVLPTSVLNTMIPNQKNYIAIFAPKVGADKNKLYQTR